MRITVIGELCEDVFVYGETKRLSPEAPVPVFKPLHTETNNGMAGNVVENLQSLNDEIDIIFIHQDEKITKIRYVEEKSNHMFIRIDEGEEEISELILTDEIVDIIKESDAVIVSDYCKGFLNDKVLTEITYHSKFSIIDSKRKVDSTLISCFNFIKLNETEYLNNQFNEHHYKKLLITLGSKGAKYDGVIYPSPNPKETIDVSGAGDTFTASFTLKYLETNDVGQSIVFANEMSSIVVSKRGVTTPYSNDINDNLDSNNL
jgi:bifunctional ADP-heptose synthase (sugar kinase/adenylyltransferase)